MDVQLRRTSDPSAFLHHRQAMEAFETAVVLRSRSTGDLQREAAHLQRRNVRMVSIRRQQVMRIGEYVVHDILTDAGLEVCALGYGGGFTGSFRTNYDDAVRDTRRAVEQAHRLNARSLVVLTGSRNSHLRKNAEANIRDGLEACVDDAFHYRVDLVVPVTPTLGNGRDVYRPENGTMLRWLLDLNQPRILPMVTLRNEDSRRALRSQCRQCLLNDGTVRISSCMRRAIGQREILKTLGRLLVHQDPVSSGAA